MVTPRSRLSTPSAPEIYCTGASLSRETILLTLANLSQTEREEVNSLIRGQGEISLEELADALAASSVPLSFHSFQQPLRYPTTPPSSRANTPAEDHPMDPIPPSSSNAAPSTNFPSYREMEKFIHSPEWILRALFAIPDITKQTHLLEYIIQNRINHYLNRTYGDLGLQLANGESTLERDGTKTTLHYYTACCSSAQQPEAKQLDDIQVAGPSTTDPDVEMIDATTPSISASTPPTKNGNGLNETPILPRTIEFSKSRFPPPRRDTHDPYFNFHTSRCRECRATTHIFIYCPDYICSSCERSAPGHYEYDCVEYYCQHCCRNGPGHTEMFCRSKKYRGKMPFCYEPNPVR